MGIMKKAVLATWLIATATGLMPHHNEIEATDAEQRELGYRLQENVKPINYDLEITVYLPEELTFEGKVRIKVEVLDDTSQIILHSYRLNVLSVMLYDETSLEIPAQHEEANDDTHFLTIKPETPLTPGTYFIETEFNAPLADDMYGFYKSSYYSKENDETRWIAATKLQTAYARRIMPCFDEPGFKATFTITINTPPGYHTRSNMPLETDYPEDAADGWKIYKFQPTKQMSTYLMAFVVSDFENLTDEENEHKFSAWARPEAKDFASYSQEIGPPLVKYFEEYTNIPYSFPKIDQVALPDYVSGATENWGLIAYRETGLLYYDRVSTESNKKSTAMVVAHELAHMWFGNLVTCKWWSDTWLNEAFANYFQYVATDDVVHSDWRLMDQFVIDQQQGIFETDSLATTPALTSECNTPAQCQARFTSISYNKGAAILRMVSHILTPESFQEALKNYLKKHEYDSTVPDDLFNALEDQRNSHDIVPFTVHEFLTPWTTQPGYPVIHVNRNGNIFTLSQERFLLKDDPEVTKYTWWVPLTWTKESDAPDGFSDTQPMKWLIPEEDTIISDIDVEPSEWVIFNNQETGYYRVNYNVDDWKLITETLHTNPEKIHVLNRAQLVDDALNLARADKLQYSVALDLVDYLHYEDDYIPWASATTAFSFLNRKLASEEGHTYFKTYMLNLIADKYVSLGFDVSEDDPHLTHFHRASVLNWACRFGREDCITNAQTKFKDYMNDKTNLVDANLRNVIYCTALRTGGAEEWDFLWNVYRQSSIATEQVLILSALGCTEDEEILQEYLNLSIDPNSEIRKQDTASVFSAVYSNAVGVDIALEFLINKYQDISENYGRQNSLSSILTGIAGRLTTEEQVAKLEKFINETADNLGAAAGAGRSAIESARADLEWTQTHKEAIINWYKEKVNPTTTDPTTTTTTTTVTSTTVTSTTDAASTLDHNVIISFTIALICTYIM